MNRTLLIAIVIGSFGLLGCEQNKTPDPTTTGTPTTKSPSETTNAATANPVTPPAPQPVTIADTDLSTPADFEEEAEKAITAKNYKTELASIEADVAKE
jgi:hypothetical protein